MRAVRVSSLTFNGKIVGSQNLLDEMDPLDLPVVVSAPPLNWKLM
jgi:hypothetical protein